MVELVEYLKAVSKELADWQGVVVALAFLFPLGLLLGSRRIASLKDSRPARYMSFTLGILLLFACQFSVWAAERKALSDFKELIEAAPKSVTPAVAPSSAESRPEREVKYVPIPTPGIQPTTSAIQNDRPTEQSLAAKRQAIEGLLNTASLVDTINQRSVGSDRHLTDIAEWQARARTVLQTFYNSDEVRRFNEVEPLEVPTPVGVSIDAGQRIARYRAQKIELRGYIPEGAS